MPELPEIRKMAEYVQKAAANLVIEATSRGKEMRLKLISCEKKGEGRDHPNQRKTIDENEGETKTKSEVKVEGEEEIERKVEGKPKSAAEPEDTSVFYVIFQSGMTGFWKMCNVDQLHKHAHCRFHSKDGGKVLCFIDSRRFGNWRVGSWDPERSPDPTIEFQEFCFHLAKNWSSSALRKPICTLLLDQTFFNGIGNYLRAEILHRISVQPFTPAADAILSSIPSEKRKDLQGEGAEGEREVKTEGEEAKKESGTETKRKRKRGTEMKEGITGELLQHSLLLQKCRELPLEVLQLANCKSYEDAAGPCIEGQSFDNWLKCYGKLSKAKDSGGRTIWFAQAGSNHQSEKVGKKERKNAKKGKEEAKKSKGIKKKKQTKSSKKGKKISTKNLSLSQRRKKKQHESESESESGSASEWVGSESEKENENGNESESELEMTVEVERPPSKKRIKGLKKQKVEASLG